MSFDLDGVGTQGRARGVILHRLGRGFIPGTGDPSTTGAGAKMQPVEPADPPKSRWDNVDSDD